MGDKISFSIGLNNFKKINLKFANNLNWYLSTLIVAKRNIPFDLKIFLTIHKKYTKQFILEKNPINHELLKNEISLIFFIIKKFKESAEYFINLINFKYGKTIKTLINKNLYFEWLQNLNTNSFWNKTGILYLKFNRNKRSNYSDIFCDFLLKNKSQEFLKIIKCFRNDILFSLHRHQLFINYKKMLAFEFYSTCRKNNTNILSKKFKIIKFSRYICKEISKTNTIYLHQKYLIYKLRLLKTRDLNSNSSLSELFNLKLMQI
nr:hypothetical protein CcurKRNrm2_p076 [Cryptomonas curvata]